ncbi:sensor histidine kinase [Methylobacterium sp. A54F]
MEPTNPAGRAETARAEAPAGGPRWPLPLAGALILGILAADIATPADNVSICFAYTLPILLGVYARPRSAFALALASTLASLIGSFIRPPGGGIAVPFVANRGIAVTAQWLVAYLIEQRRRARALVEGHLEAERRKAETGRRFVQILTHEIATALTAIGGHSARLAKLAPGIAPAEIVARSEKIGQAAARLDALVNRIREAAEVGEGDLAPTPVPIEAGPFLAALQAEHGGEGGPNLILGADETVIHADRDLLYQAVSNLIGNAVKYSSAPAEVTVTVARSALTGGAAITVGDRGIGIAPDEVGRVLEPYYRARNSGGIRGLGLGLHLVRHTVEAHGGSVHIASTPGAGTRVSLHLPPGPKLPPGPRP